MPMKLRPSGSSFYVRVRSWQHLTLDERATVTRGGEYPVEDLDYLPEHETFLNFLIDGSLKAWSPSSG